MPRYPATEPKVDAIRASVFARLIERMAAHGGPRYPLHIGDTCLDPPEACRLDALAADPPVRPYAYSHPFGTPLLREALAAKVRDKNGLDWAGPDHVTVTAGATHALSCACQTLLSPGDEVLIPAPYWPLIAGIVRAAGATPVEVPFWPLLGDDDVAASAVALLEPHVTTRTAALYVNTPSNPTGRVLPRAALEALVDLADRHGLWILSDEAYEHYTFGDTEHCSLASLDGAPGRTVTAWTFSKSYALAGYRAGYLAGPAAVIERVRKVSNHSIYSVPGVVQEACLRALEHGDAWLDDARALYAAGARLVAERLRGRFHPAEGGAYVWIEIDEDGWGFLERCLEAGVSLAPGAGFGAGFDRAMRLCYVACDLETLTAGVDALNHVLETGSAS